MVEHPHVVQLDAEHPGFRDFEYRKRRDLIALASDKYEGTPESIPLVEYTESEQDVWRFVSKKLKELGKKYACEKHLHGMEILGISDAYIPQLRNISEIMIKQTGFQMAPVKGLVPGKEFMQSFSKGVFYSTQYIRHHSNPGFTPEPDIIHEILGHAGGLCDEMITKIAREIGNAALKTEDTDTLLKLERIYWFVIEYGLCKEGNIIKAFGAGNLSSYIDIQRSVEDKSCHFPFNVEEIVNTPYDPTVTQNKLFFVDSFEDCYVQVKQFCDTVK